MVQRVLEADPRNEEIVEVMASLRQAPRARGTASSDGRSGARGGSSAGDANARA